MASSVKAGDYEIAEPISPLELLNRITKGDISQSEIKFIEGWTFSQLGRRWMSIQRYGMIRPI